MSKENYLQLSEQAMEQLTKNGAFLTAESINGRNTMTISWALLGTIWSKPVMLVAVRNSRHTNSFIDQSNQFTVSVPKYGEFKKQLAFCGTQSGRDYNKFEECQLKTKKGKEISTPVIDECQLYFECKTLYKQPLDPNLLDEAVRKTFAESKENHHVIYYGEIVACYKE